ncbi:MAG: radical SAM protein [Verrucomicrobia bacterium]|nr:radical SAM protein [Verrucomicrobiota bacterium]
MSALTGSVVRGSQPTRALLARQRSAAARAALGHCDFCGHRCGVNRLAGQRGPCGAGAEARVFCARIDMAEDLDLVPTFAIALSGCDLRCAFCITGESSWNPRAGVLVDPRALAARAEAALSEGARTIMVLGGEPTVHLPAVLEIVAALPPTAKLVWKTNAHASAVARRFLDGLFDVWLADYKFGNDDCAQRLAGVADYTRVVRENLAWAGARTDLIVRHLVMPGHLECCWRPVAAWLATKLPNVPVSLRCGFWPAWQAGRCPELRSGTTARAAAQARAIAREFGLCLVA